MIERYSLPEMQAIWELQNKYDTWLKVELAVVAAQAELGLIPKGDADRIITRATFCDAKNADLRLTDRMRSQSASV